MSYLSFKKLPKVLKYDSFIFILRKIAKKKIKWIYISHEKRLIWTRAVLPWYIYIYILVTFDEKLILVMLSVTSAPSQVLKPVNPMLKNSNQ